MFLKKYAIENIVLQENSTIRDVINAIDSSKLKIAFLVDTNEKLISTICDGDIRRGLIAGKNLESEAKLIANKEFISINTEVTTKEVHKIMQKKRVAHIPVINNFGQIIGMHFLDNFILDRIDEELPNTVLIMAGGRGKRLMPLTEDCPKPLLEIKGKPILEIILENCKKNGINNFLISTFYLSNKIKNYFGDGSKWNVEIKYLEEPFPLGTAGSLSLISNNLNSPILIINGDVLTKVSIRDIINFHEVNEAEITLCGREYQYKVPFGVLNSNGINFESIVEKPSYKHLINAGIYVLSPSVINSINTKKFLEMTELIENMKKEGKKIIVYPIYEYWLDIGRLDSLNQAYDEWMNIE